MVKRHWRWPLLLLVMVPDPSSVSESPQREPRAAVKSVPVPPSPYCPSGGEYADDFSALNPAAHELEKLTPTYTVCIRTTATYECPSYGPDGNLRKKKRQVVAHGTGFAYRQQGGETFLLTNEHVADWPAVTQEDHPVEDVPVGCKKVADAIKIVDNDSDNYERDDIALTRVVSDGELDIAILKSKVPVPILPWAIGHSAGLKERNVVNVRGFPLGVFKANNVGKVVSAYDHDTYKDWDHDDFVIDALLSPGNSGSPVFAISCRTGAFELVGVFHAGYSRGSALNVVVGIDQVRDLMTTFKRAPKPRPDATVALDGDTRAKLLASSRLTVDPFFPFGPLVAAVRPRDDGSMLHEVMNRNFPFRSYPILVLEDLPPSDSDPFGSLGRVWIGNRQGLKPYARADLDSDAQSQIGRLLGVLRRDAVSAFAIRDIEADSSSTRESFKRIERLEKAFQKTIAGRADVAQSAIDLAERLGPQSDEASTDLRTILLPAEQESVSPAPVVPAPAIETPAAPAQ